MNFWAVVTGAIALSLGAVSPSVAQDQAAAPDAAVATDPAQTPEDEILETAALLVDKLRVLSEGLGIDDPLLPQEALASALSAALPVLPSDEPGLSWSSSFAFDFKTDRSTGELEPDEEGRTVFTDARACLEPEEIADVVHFQRFTRSGVRGHRCIISFGGGAHQDVWVLQSRTFAEGPQRRLSAYYGVATAVEGDLDRARRVLEERLDQNVALAGVMADYALEMFLQREASSDPLTAENMPERLARLQERLVEVGESLESLGRTATAAESSADD